LSVWILPSVGAAAPEVLQTFSGTLTDSNPVEWTWELNRDIPDPGFLFHYVITGGSDSNDVVSVYIDDTGDGWEFLMGEGWEYCSPLGLSPCPIDAGSHPVTVVADIAATLPIDYEIAFYLPPEPSVDFSGQFPANSDMRVSSFGVLFPSSTSGQLVLNVASGSYEFFVDGESTAVVTALTELPVNFEGGFHTFEINSEFEGVGEDVAWSVRIPAMLNVVIVNSCPPLNPEAGQSVCITGAEVTASDGSSPVVTYSWNASGGSFNSTSSQWVEWTAPQTVGDLSLTVQAFSPGYLSGTKSLVATVVPEFTTVALPFILAVALAVLSISRRSRRHHIAPNRTRVSCDHNGASASSRL
jgi:hypothetical protein